MTSKYTTVGHILHRKYSRSEGGNVAQVVKVGEAFTRGALHPFKTLVEIRIVATSEVQTHDLSSLKSQWK